MRRLLVPYLPATSLRCQASIVAGVTGQMAAQRLRGMSRASAASHSRSAGPYRYPARVAEHEQLGILRQVAAGYQDSEAQYPAN